MDVTKAEFVCSEQTPKPMPSVLIVDDDLLAREGLKYVLNQEQRGLVFGEATTAGEAAACLVRGSWDVVVIEESIAAPDGFRILQDLHRSYPATRFVVLGLAANPKHAVRAGGLKAFSYARKGSSRAELVKAFVRVLASQEHLTGPGHDEPGNGRTPGHAPLSNRERDVLLACVRGQRVGEIAAEYHLSVKTVSTYKRRILDKLRLNSVADLVRYAIDQKLC
jgi:two-component system, NarL family, invasion response regulator UvrY